MAPDANAILDGLKQLVHNLEFELVNLRAPRDGAQVQLQSASTAPTTLTKLAYLAGPLAANIVPLDHTYEIICACNMKRTWFWEHVKEKLDLDAELVVPRYDERVSIDGHRLNQYTSGSLSHAKIVLCYYWYTERDFDGENIRLSQWQKDTRIGWSATAHDALLINKYEAYDSLELNRRIMAADKLDTPSNIDAGTKIHAITLYQKFASAYSTLRGWAYMAGLLSARFNMITDKMLLTLLGRAFSELDLASEEDWVPRILRTEPFAYIIEHGFYVTAFSSICLTDSWKTAPGLDAAFCRAAQITRDDCHKPVGLDLFLRDYHDFIKVQGTCWGSQEQKAVFEDLLPKAILALDVGHWIWPFSFTHAAKGEAIFLIGHSLKDDPDCKRCATSWEKLDRILDQLKVDRKVSFVTLEIVSQENAQLLVREAKKAIQDKSAGEERAEKRPEEAAGNVTSTQTDIADATTNSSEKRRFRTALETMNRLRWDPSLNDVKYEVGYVDRFEKDLMWKALDKWEKHTEEEEFIPEHRIMKIRTVIQQETIWDREKREDKT